MRMLVFAQILMEILLCFVEENGKDVDEDDDDSDVDDEDDDDEEDDEDDAEVGLSYLQRSGLEV
jgi:hypothetical protein